MSASTCTDTFKVKVKKWLGARLIYGLNRAIFITLRVKLQGWEKFEGNDQKLIFCGWHGKSIIFANYFRNRKYWVLISNSNDGDIQAEIFRRLGYQCIRGSTGRGGVRAALQGVKLLKDGGTMAMTPDGPRGPSGVVQGGVMLMAQKSGAGLVPVGIDSKPCARIKSWDKHMIPLPFARGRMIFGDPIYLDEKATPEQVEEVRLKLENEIHRLEAEAVLA